MTKKTIIKNFTGSQSLSVQILEHDSLVETVMLLVCEGSLSFQHNMTPDQARQMGKALYDYAHEIDSHMLRVAA